MSDDSRPPGATDFSSEELGELFRTLCFAARKHRDQRRKDPQASPYVNHPIEVADVLIRVGGVTRLRTIQAALLHDTIEDTDTTGDEIEREFDAEVRELVEDVTDDKRLPKAERKRLQVENASELCDAAKEIKLADKICNIRDITHKPPPDWSAGRRSEYLDWGRDVATGCHGVNAALDRAFEQAFSEGRARLAERDE